MTGLLGMQMSYAPERQGSDLCGHTAGSSQQEPREGNTGISYPGAPTVPPQATGCSDKSMIEARAPSGASREVTRQSSRA